MEFKFRNSEQEGDRMIINKTAVKTMDILELFYEHEELKFNRDGSAYKYAENICLSFNWLVRRNGVFYKKTKREISFRSRVFYGSVNLFHKDYP